MPDAARSRSAGRRTTQALTRELDETYRRVAARLPENDAVRFETVGDKTELVLSPLEALEEPPSLIDLRDEIKARMPRVDLSEILLEIAGRTDCMEAFTHLTERTARAADLTTILCAVLMAEACNTGRNRWCGRTAQVGLDWIAN